MSGHRPEVALSLRLVLARITGNEDAEDDTLREISSCCAGCVIDGLADAAELVARTATWIHLGSSEAEDGAILLVQDCLEFELGVAEEAAR